ncbi:MAG: hypothetical protein ACRD2C_19250 [Acidimicrobiales bacterium]
MDQPRRRRRVVVLVIGTLVWGLATLLLQLHGPGGDQEAPTAPATRGQEAPPTSQPGATGGPMTERSGLPAGFSHDEAGAVAAAVAYAGASQRWLYWTDGQIATAVAEMATPEAAERLTDEIVATVRAARDELAESPGRVWWLVHPLAWRVDRYSPGRATVAVWTMRLLSASDVAVPQTEWLTSTLDLDWVNGDWRLAEVRDTAGPTPMTGPRDEPWQPEPFDEALAGFTRLDGEPVMIPRGS